MRRSHVLVLIEFSLNEDNFFSALIGVRVTVTKNDWLRLLPRETFFFKKRFLPTKQFLGKHVWACQDGLVCIVLPCRCALRFRVCVL